MARFTRALSGQPAVILLGAGQSAARHLSLRHAARPARRGVLSLRSRCVPCDGTGSESENAGWEGLRCVGRAVARSVILK